MTPVEPSIVARRLSGLAVVAVLLGLAAVVPYLWFVAALPAVVVGYVALYRVNASAGQLRGRPLAIAGMALGGVGCLVAVVALVLIVYARLKFNSERALCADNLRRLGESIQLYHDANSQTFPRATLSADLPPEERLSWLAGQLPYLDRRKDGTS